MASLSETTARPSLGAREGRGVFNPVIRKLENFVRFSPEERDVLETIEQMPVRRVLPRTDVVREGDRTPHVYAVLDGWACRYKTLPDGRRQIVDLLLPGDLCDAFGFVLERSDFSMGAITRLRLAEISRERFESLFNSSHRLTQAIWWNVLTNLAIQREWTINLGQRTAVERLSHFFCEAFARLAAVGLTQQDSCDFPLVQQDLADITGLTLVHVNRTLQEMRRSELIVLRSRKLTIPSIRRLQDVALFDSQYLHLGGSAAGTMHS